MTPKGILRYLIAVVLVAVILSVVLPLVGLPRSELIAPPIAYAAAGATTDGYVTNRSTAPTANVFKVGDLIYFVEYQFRGLAIPAFGEHGAVSRTPVVYKGRANVSLDFYNAVQFGQKVPVKYDPGYPVISGITGPNGGRNVNDGAGLLSAWIAWDIAILGIAYPVAMLLERFILRESY